MGLVIKQLVVIFMTNKNKVEVDGKGNKAAGRDFHDKSTYYQTYITEEPNLLRFFDKEIKNVIKEFAKVAKLEVGKKLRINIPSLDTQKKVTNALSTMDD